MNYDNTLKYEIINFKKLIKNSKQKKIIELIKKKD